MTTPIDKAAAHLIEAREEIAARGAELEQELAEIREEDRRLETAFEALKGTAGYTSRQPAKPKAMPASKPPARSPAEDPSRRAHRKEQIRRVIFEADVPVARRDIMEKVELPAKTVSRLLSELLSEQIITSEGERAGTRYTPATPRRNESGHVGRKQEPSEQGKILTALFGRRCTAAEVANNTGISAQRVNEILGQLVKDGDVAMYQGGVYSAKP